MAQSKRRTASQGGFASMDKEKQREIAAKGGHSVSPEERSFAKDPELATEAGRKGGKRVPQEKRSFSKDSPRKNYNEQHRSTRTCGHAG